MSNRIPCSNPECTNTILPATAQANGGLCAPCVGAVRQREHAEYVRLNRRMVDLYAGLTDLAEMAEVMLTERRRDELITYAPSPLSREEMFAQLDAAGAARLSASAMCHLAEGNEDLAEALAKHLALLTDHDLSVLQEAWSARHHCVPAEMFRNASPQVRDRIIQALERGESNPSEALCALAWVGDDVVAKAFQRWDVEMPSWARSLRVPPSAYTDEAGWEVVEGGRRNLSYETCLALSVADERDVMTSPPVKTFAPSGSACPWCFQPLSHMIALDLEDLRLKFIPFAGPKLPVLTCHRCACYGPFFAKVDSAGEALPHPGMARPRYLPDSTEQWDLPAWAGVTVSLAPRRAIHAVDWGMELKSSQIGGLPCWVQNAEYPKCPDCARTMSFLAQLNDDDFPGHEGTHYAFLCAACRVTSTGYQQT